MGRTANHAVVMAQLMIDGKSYGPHPFVVQIRDMKTHEPLENIHVGDIGPKFGYNTMDNGFLLLNNVKVPHIHMLAKFSGVDLKTNKYVKPASASLVYGTLVSHTFRHFPCCVLQFELQNCKTCPRSNTLPKPLPRLEPSPRTDLLTPK